MIIFWLFRFISFTSITKLRMITNRPDTCYSSVEREDKLIHDFIHEFPLPLYNECIKIIKSFTTDDLAIDIYSEFGEMNHRIINGMLEHFNDEEYIKTSSKLIMGRGDKRTLIMNMYFINRYVYYVIKNSGLTFSRHEQIILLSLNKRFEGIIFA